MGIRFKKSFNVGFFRTNLTKSGIGYSFGVPGFRFGVNSTGQRYISIGIPGTGLYYIKCFRGKSKDVEII